MADKASNGGPVSKPVGLFPPAPKDKGKEGEGAARRGPWGQAGVQETNAPF